MTRDFENARTTWVIDAATGKDANRTALGCLGTRVGCLESDASVLKYWIETMKRNSST